MRLAILFWFYKEEDVCLNRLEILRKYNPHIGIFGLYGGAPSELASFKSLLGPYLDDLYSFDEEKRTQWKWLNGDLVINAWYREEGRSLKWDTIAVIQWDMLVFDNIANIYSEMGEGEILLSGMRPVSEVASWWPWTKPGRYEQLEVYMKHVRTVYGYTGEPWCCNFVVACLPREFLDNYSKVVSPELGFIEYRVPTYARIFGIPFCQSTEFRCWWNKAPNAKKTPRRDRTINAGSYFLPLRIVRWHLRQAKGKRLFHPFEKVYPVDFKSTLRFVGQTLVNRRKIRSFRNRLQRYYSVMTKSITL